MTDRVVLTGGAEPVAIGAGGYTLQAPGLVGEVAASGGYTGTRSIDDGGELSAIDQALGRAGIEQLQRFEIAPDPAASHPSTTRGVDDAGQDAPLMVLTTPATRPHEQQVVLYTDESGYTRWVLPSSTPADGYTGTRSIDSGFIFHLPSESAAPPADSDDSDAPATRGVISQTFRKVVRVLTWATDDLTEEAAYNHMKAWEDAERPSRIKPAMSEGSPPIAELLTGGRALVIIHGTFSTFDESYWGMTNTSKRALRDLYGGRVIAFDHPTVHLTPTENAEHFVQLLRENHVGAEVPVELDIIAHSRGGLVAREIARLAHEGRAGKLKVRRLVMVATPNAGTPLVNADHAVDMLDRFTNLFTKLSDTPLTLSVEALFAAGKWMLHGWLNALPGLQAMNPTGETLQRINSGPALPTQIYAVAANYTPVEPGLQRLLWKLQHRFMDFVFQDAENDMTVPVLGAWQGANGAPGFPVPEERRLLVSPNDGVYHSVYFHFKSVIDQILAWLRD